MTPEVALDLWRARFGDRWTTADEAVAILEDADWRKILYLCRTGTCRVESAYPGPGMHPAVYRLTPDKESNGNS